MGGWFCQEQRFCYQDEALEISIALDSGHESAAPAYRPELAAEVPGLSPFLLWEWAEYRVTVTPEIDGLEVLIGDEPARSFGRGLYSFRYENAVGASRLRFRGVQAPDLPVEVLSRKFASAGALAGYPALYRSMVQELTAILLTLPFDLSGATAHGTRATDGPPSPLFALHFLRHHGGQIAEALQAVAFDPHRLLTREEVIRPVAQVRRLDGAAIRWGLTHPESWATTRQRGWFELSGQAVLPLRLLQERAEETMDTHENRFVKRFVADLLEAADRVLALLDRVAPGRAELRAGLAETRAALDEALGWPWWEEVGELVYLPEGSTVLHRKDGYRELWALYPEFLLSRTPFGAGLERAIASRNVAALYEYWCYFRLVERLAPVLGAPRLRPEADETGGLAHGVAARFGDGTWRLVFNRSARGGGESYSLGLRPDFTLLGPDGPELVFDAKFRLEAPPPSLEDPVAAQTSPQAGDLYKMHTYRDALGVRAAVALYPGDRPVFYDRRTRRRRGDVTLDELVHGEIEGVGALPLRPEGGSL